MFVMWESIGCVKHACSYPCLIDGQLRVEGRSGSGNRSMADNHSAPTSKARSNIDIISAV